MGSLLVCTYGESGDTMDVVITDDAYLEVRDQLGCELEWIAQRMVRRAVNEGLGQGTVHLFEEGFRYQDADGTEQTVPLEAFVKSLAQDL